MSFEFTNPLVAAAYVPRVEKDRIVHVGCYSGLLSNVTDCAADRLFSRQSNLIGRKNDESPSPVAYAAEANGPRGNKKNRPPSPPDID